METVCMMKGFAIAVVDRGFVYVGDIEHDGEWCHINNAKNIRIWGTEKGLGELALNGPRSKTVLDPVGRVSIPRHALIHLIETERSKWI